MTMKKAVFLLVLGCGAAVIPSVGTAGMTVNGIAVTAEAAPDWSYEATSGVLRLQAGTFALSGEDRGLKVCVEQDARLVLSDARLESDGAPVLIGAGVTVHLELVGTNVLVAADGHAGIELAETNSTLVVEASDPVGRLTVAGGWGGAGIGTAPQGRLGTVEVRGGVIEAIGGFGAAGIGAGAQGSDGCVRLTGGSVTVCGTGVGDFGGTAERAAPVVICGGSVRCSRSPTEGSVAGGEGGTNAVACVRVRSQQVTWAEDAPLAVDGLPDWYGVANVVPVGGEVCFWLTPGRQMFSVGGCTFVADVTEGTEVQAVEVLPESNASDGVETCAFEVSGLLEGEGGRINELTFTLRDREPLWGRTVKVASSADGAFTVRLHDQAGPAVKEAKFVRLAQALEIAGTNRLQLSVVRATDKQGFVLDLPPVVQIGVADQVRRVAGEFWAGSGLKANKIDAWRVKLLGGALRTKSLIADDSVVVNGKLTVNGSTVVKGPAKISGPLTASGTVQVNGNAVVTSSVQVVSYARAKSVSGVTKLTAKDSLFVGGSLAGVPVGTIVMWTKPGAPPDGWAICDGRPGTPDLRGQFVVGAGGKYAKGDTGGKTEVFLDTDQLPKHEHMTAYRFAGYARGLKTSREVRGVQADGRARSEFLTSTAKSNGQEWPNAVGAAHPNMPRYYALVYIIKLGKGGN